MQYQLPSLRNCRNRIWTECNRTFSRLAFCVAALNTNSSDSTSPFLQYYVVTHCVWTYHCFGVTYYFKHFPRYFNRIQPSPRKCPHQQRCVNEFPIDDDKRVYALKTEYSNLDRNPVVQLCILWYIVLVRFPLV